jgi:hypothetical protein
MWGEYAATRIFGCGVDLMEAEVQDPGFDIRLGPREVPWSVKTTATGFDDLEAGLFETPKKRILTPAGMLFWVPEPKQPSYVELLGWNTYGEMQAYGVWLHRRTKYRAIPRTMLRSALSLFEGLRAKGGELELYVCQRCRRLFPPPPFEGYPTEWPHADKRQRHEPAAYCQTTSCEATARGKWHVLA